MRHLLKISRGGILWGVLIFLAIPLAQEPVVARMTPSVKPIKIWTGTASWYGQDFEGRITASGEPYDMNADTAADPSLPFGSIIRIINTKTGKSQLARINDRGPFVDGRDLDVSYQVARNLGIVGRGVARLRIELLEVPPRHE